MHTPIPPPTPTNYTEARVSRLTVTRLFSTAQYEHLKVEVTVDLTDELTVVRMHEEPPLSAEPADVLRDLVDAVEAMRPESDDTRQMLEHYEQCLAKALVDGSTQQAIDEARRRRDAYAAEVKEAEASRVAALAKLNHLGATVTET